MVSLWLEVPEDERELVAAELWEAGTAGITEQREGLVAFFDEEADTGRLLDQFARYAPEIQNEPERDWQRESEDAWQPMEVGQRFWLLPEWRDDPAPPGRLTLRIHPGMACGTGAGPATQLCLEAMERWVPAEASVLDVGTGTGILADAARLLGAGRVAACDIDAEASEIARRNVAAEIGVFTGSLRAVASRSFDVVVANLNAETLTGVAGDMLRVRRDGGVCIVAGFRTHEDERMANAFGAEPRDSLTSGEWACMVF